MIHDIIAQSLSRSYSYEEYNSLVASLVEQHSSTGGNDPVYVEYTKLNASRANRVDKTTEISEDNQLFFKEIEREMTWLVITESWCADAAQIVPVLHKIAALNPLWSFRLVLRDKNEELMNNFLTAGAKSIPMLILTTPAHHVLKVWGPRPSTATAMVEEFKAMHQKLTPEFKTELQRWYNADKGQTIITDLVKTLQGL